MSATHPEPYDPGPEDNPTRRPASRLTELRTGRWLDQQHFAPVRWAVPGLIPEGFGLLTGPPKVGKSWATLGVALAVASGGVAFGKIRVGQPRPVLLFALEDGDRRMQDRCRHLLGPDDPIPEQLDYLTEATSNEVMDTAADWLDQHHDQHPLVVIDTLGKVMPTALAGEGAYQRDYRVGSALKRLVAAHPGSTLLVVHHVRKSVAGGDSGGDWMDSTSGTNGLNGAADWTLNLHRPRNEDNGVARVTGRDVREGEYAVTCTSGAWILDGDTLDAAAQAYAQQRVVRDLGERSADVVDFVANYGQPVSPKDVEAALELPDARRYLARLADSGRLLRIGRGKYVPVPTVPTVSTVPTVPNVPSEALPTPVPTVPMSQDDTPLTSHPLSQEGVCDGTRDSGDTGTEGQQRDTNQEQP